MHIFIILALFLSPPSLPTTGHKKPIQAEGCGVTKVYLWKKNKGIMGELLVLPWLWTL